jgi:molybdate transport system substrate-binding protein
VKRLAGLLALIAITGLSPAGHAEPDRGEVVVFEAASLRDVFSRLAAVFESAHPGVKVVANAAGSQELRAQIEQGANADVFASADRQQMDSLAARKMVAPASIFTCNEPVVIVRPGLAATIKSLGDLPRAERIVIGVPDVPIGNYTLQILRKAGAKAGGPYGADFPARVQAKVASRELNVRQVLAKVKLGEADAGVVYRSDALTAPGKVQVVNIPPDLNVIAEYPIALLAAPPHRALAQAWLDLVLSPVGQGKLREAGFTACPKH